MSSNPGFASGIFWLLCAWLLVQIVFRCWLVPASPSSSSSSSSKRSDSVFDAGACMVSMSTTKGADAIYRVAQPVRGCLRSFYQAGVCAGVACFFLAVVVLAYCLVLSVQSLWVKLAEDDPSGQAQAKAQGASASYDHGSYSDGPSGAVAIAIPGITIPLSHALYFFGAVLLSVLFHELGHAVAAAAHGVHVDGITVFLAVVFPGAYVALSDYDGLSLKARLQIAAAGVWHNLILSLVCVLLLWHPGLVLGPTYAPVHDGVYIAESNELLFQNQLVSGDRVVRLDDVPVTLDTWGEVLFNMTDPGSNEYHTSGRCVLSHYTQLYSEDTSCCKYGLEENGGLAVQCFEFDDSAEQAADACMPAKEVLGAFDSRCSSNDDCSNNMYGDAFTCMHMKLDASYERLILLSVEGDHAHGNGNGNGSEVVFFVGYPLDILHYVRAVPFSPRSWWTGLMPSKLINVRLFPLYLDTFLRYVFSISTSLALLNSAPIMHSDGMHSVQLYMDVLHAHKWSKGKHYTKHMIWLCTFVMTLNVLLSLLLLII